MVGQLMKGASIEEIVDNNPRSFYNAKVYISGLCFEYGFRKIASLLNPELKEREKDHIAKEVSRKQN